MKRSVYFAKPVDADGPIKIGCTGDVNARLACMNSMSPVEIEIVLAVPGGFDEERHLHSMFSADQVRGEWFAATPALMLFLDELRAGRTLIAAPCVVSGIRSAATVRGWETRRANLAAREPARPEASAA